MIEKAEIAHMGLGKEVELTMPDGSKKKVYLEPLAMGHAYKYIPLTIKFAGVKEDKIKEIMADEKVIKTITELIEVMLKKAGVEEIDKVGVVNYMVLMNTLFEINSLGASKDMSALKERMRLVRKSSEPTGEKEAEKRPS